MINLQVGNVVIDRLTGLVAEVSAVTSGGFSAYVVSPGLNSRQNPVGQLMTNLNPIFWMVLGETKEGFLEAFSLHLASQGVSTVDAALAGFGGAS